LICGSETCSSICKVLKVLNIHCFELDCFNNNNNNNNNNNKQVQTDRTIPNNKPDIIIRDNEKGTCMLIYVAISGDRNVIKKEAEKIFKV
jgi:hypothetical protein